MIKLFESFVTLKDLTFITWWGNGKRDFSNNNIYVLLNTSKHTVFYKDYNYSIPTLSNDYYRVLTDEELENYIYNNKRYFKSA